MVHLDECFEQAALKVSGALGSSIDGVEISTFKEIGTCFGGWFFKSTTNLYGFDIGLPWYFGLFCLNFCIGGIAMLVLKPKWAATTIFPYDAFAYILLFIQGPLCFMADYMNMEKDSLFHVLDRIFALPLTFLELFKIIIMLPRVHRTTAVLYALSFAIAIYSHVQSSAAQTRQDVDALIFWHNMWHMYPIFATVVTMFDVYILGSYEAIEEESKVNKQTTPPSLSTVILKKLHDSEELQKKRM